MTDYKAIKGKTIKNLASDLDNAEGDVPADALLVRPVFKFAISVQDVPL